MPGPAVVRVAEFYHATLRRVMPVGDMSLLWSSAVSPSSRLAPNLFGG
jgi:hypothetical protein